jgi:hypothetical protein
VSRVPVMVIPVEETLSVMSFLFETASMSIEAGLFYAKFDPA